MNKPTFKVIIAGGRDFNDYELLREKCDKYLSSKLLTHSIVILSGSARGADSLGERYAAEHNFQIQRFPANWEKDGKCAGFLRNKQMAEAADALVAFWDGRSRGTGHMISLARMRNLQVRIVSY